MKFLHNFCIYIRQAIVNRSDFVDIDYDFFCYKIAIEMVRRGYIRSILKISDRKFRVFLRYVSSEVSLIKNVECVYSKRRKSISLKNLKIKFRFSEVLLSTSNGILFKNKALANGCGGVPLLVIYF